MSHTSGIHPIDGSFISKFEEFPSIDNVGGAGGWNCTPHLGNPLTNLFLKSKSWHLSMMKP
jgi:hypothetical protein